MKRQDFGLRIFTLLFAFAFIQLSAWSQCSFPVGLTLVSSSINSVNLKINTSPTSTSPWQIQYGSVGFLLGSGTTSTVTTKTPTINGLQGSTTYDFYVRDTCSAGVSAWVGPVRFNTACIGIIQAPLVEDFESSNWLPPISFVYPGTLASCWSTSPQGSLLSWSVGPPYLNQIQTGPDQDHTSGTGKYIHVGSFGFSNDLVSYLSLPKVSLTNLTTPKLDFWYHIYGVGIERFDVIIRSVNTTVWDTLLTLSGEQQLSKIDPWLNMNLSLSNYLNDTVEIQFIGSRANYSPYVEISIDDLSIADSTTCIKPTAFQVVSNNTQSVLLDWTPGYASHWQVEYGLAGFALGSGIRQSINSHPYLVNGLLSNQLYEFYIRDSCGANDLSGWVGPILAIMDCASILGPHFEDFEDTTWVKPITFNVKGEVNACWKQRDSSIFYWDIGPSFINSYFTGALVDHTTGTGKFIQTNRVVHWGYNATPIYSPLIRLTNINSPELTFWYHMYGGTIAGLEVAIDSGDGFYVIKNLVGQQQPSQTDAWKESVINLSSYAGKMVKIRFKGKSAFTISNLCRIGVDDFSLHEAPLCPKPRNVAVSQIGYTDAKLDWTSGGALNWIIRYQETGGSLNYATANTTSFILAGLQSGAEYTVWVRDSCGVGNVSDWSASVEFRTLCTPMSTPYFENFDANGFTSQPGFLLHGEINSCWKRFNQEGFFWESGPTYFLSPTTGPISDHTTGSGQYLVSELFNFVINDTAKIVSPQIDLSNLTVPEMSYWYHMYGSGIQSLVIQVDTGGGWMALDTIIGEQQTAKTSPWKERVLDLSMYSDTVQFMFVAVRATFYNQCEISIDDFHIYEKTNCEEPSDIVLKNITSNTAKIRWKKGDANQWVVRYKSQGGTFNYDTTSIKNPYILKNLNSDTKYEFWVRDSCSAGDVSLWVGPLLIKTECSPFMAPYLEDFESADWTVATITAIRGKINSCWTISDTAFLSWVPVTGSLSGVFSGPSSSRLAPGNYMMFNHIQYTIPRTSAELRSPSVVISNMTLPELNFYYHMFGANIDKLEVYAEKLNGSRTLLSTLTGQQMFAKTAAWKLKTISLNAFKNDTIKVVFVGHKTPGYAVLINIAIDDVEIADAFCGNPSSLTVSNRTANSADIDWVSGSTRSNIEYDLSGFTQGQGILHKNVSSIYSLTGLLPFTAYDVYVMDSCRMNNSAWVGPFTFTTFCDTPAANFSIVKVNLGIKFDAAASLGNHLKYMWDYGDGNFGTGVSTLHQYQTGGNYTITLVATDTCGLTDTVVQNVEVCNPAKAIFSYTVNGLIVSFNASSSVGAGMLDFYWDFGPPGNYINSNPNVVFPSQGVYPIWLRVSDTCGGVDTAFMNLQLCDPPQSFFTYKIISSGGNGMTVDFDGALSKNVVSFKWLFGDGTSDTTTLQPTHVYAIPGLHYIVSLQTKASCGLLDTMTYKMEDVVGIDEKDGQQIEVYPNPASDRVIIKMLESNGSFSVLWFNSNGKEIQLQALSRNASSVEFDVSKLSSGLYHLVISNAKGEFTRSVLIE